MNPKNQTPPSALDLARQTRKHLAEIRQIVLTIASEYEWDEDMSPKIDQIEVSLGRVFRGVSALLKHAK